MVNIGDEKILMPPSMVGLLLSLVHLVGHKGLTRMLMSLELYYFPTKYTVVRSFITGCYSCFMTNKSTHKVAIGAYPTPKAPFEEITCDLIENLNPINGYSHLLLIQCVLTDFTIIVPLKSKTSAEVSRAFLNSVFQQYNIKRIHSDNGPAFRSTAWLETMAALKITVIGSAVLHPAGRGQIERLVQTVKTMLKRMLAIKKDLNWEYLPYLVSKVINNTVSPKTGFTPQTMVFGELNSKSDLIDMENMLPIHPYVKNNTAHIEQLSKEISSMVTSATDKLAISRLAANDRLNKTRTKPNFKVNDYVFVLDRLNVPGASRPLKTKFSHSPYVVVRPLFSTTLVKRIADGYTALYSNADLKKFDPSSPLFSDLPKEIKKALLYKFEDLLDDDLTTIIKHDSLDIPSGITLFQDDSTINQAEKISEDVVNELTKDNLPADNFTPAVNFDIPDEIDNQIITPEVAADHDELKNMTDDITPEIADEFIDKQESDSDDEAETSPPQSTGMQTRSKSVRFKE